MDILANLGATGLIAATIVATAGAAVQASAGFGLALLIVPLLALIDPGFVPGPMLAAGIICSAGAAWRDRASIQWPALKLALIGMAAGTVIGGAALKLSQGRDLSVLFGTLVLLAVILSIWGPAFIPNPRAFLLGGGVGGLMGGMVGIHGPPLALVLQREQPPVVRAMLGSFFTVAYIWAVVVLALFSLFGRTEVVRTLVLVPGMTLGLALAPLLIARIDRARLRWIILGISAASGLILIVR